MSFKNGAREFDFQLSCPAPLASGSSVQLAHGGGGRKSAELFEQIFHPAFGNAHLDEIHDGAVMNFAGGRLAFSTDSHVVKPLFFPGGNIGSLAVNGTVNDLAMCGAKPLWLSAAFVLEEGLPMDVLRAVVESMKAAARGAGVQIVTGDTKVVDRGKCDGLYISTAGVGMVPSGVEVSPRRIEPGDAILLNGDIGRHGMAVMAQREGLQFESAIRSDCAPLNGLVDALIGEKIAVRCMRDLTRGGLASAAVELAQKRGLQFELDEAAVPVTEPVRAACEILGLDPFYVANEGRMIAFVPAEQAGLALEAMRFCPGGEASVRIGRVSEKGAPRVIAKNAMGTERIVDMLSGEQLPRIC